MTRDDDARSLPMTQAKRFDQWPSMAPKDGRDPFARNYKKRKKKEQPGSCQRLKMYRILSTTNTTLQNLFPFVSHVHVKFINNSSSLSLLNGNRTDEIEATVA